MGLEVSGLFSLIVLILDIWAIVKTFDSGASTGSKVFWILIVLLLPVLGLILWLLFGPSSNAKPGS
ncbi:MAG: PLDc N-terminal domain-containing protein [Candidatus Thiodiazotropha sp.]